MTEIQSELASSAVDQVLDGWDSAEQYEATAREGVADFDRQVMADYIAEQPIEDRLSNPADADEIRAAALDEACRILVETCRERVSA